MQTANAAKARPGGLAYAVHLGLVLLLVTIVALGYLAFRQLAQAVMPLQSAYILLFLAVTAREAVVSAT